MSPTPRPPWRRRSGRGPPPFQSNFPYSLSLYHLPDPGTGRGSDWLGSRELPSRTVPSIPLSSSERGEEVRLRYAEVAPARDHQEDLPPEVLLHRVGLDLPERLLHDRDREAVERVVDAVPGLRGREEGADGPGAGGDGPGELAGPRGLHGADDAPRGAGDPGALTPTATGGRARGDPSPPRRG